MKNLSVKDQKAAEAQKKAVKIEAADVNLLVSQDAEERALMILQCV